jgi:hypothetical protein
MYATNNSEKKLLIIQTSDGARYKPLLDATESLHRRYATRHGYDYRRFDGVKRGVKPWHAAFNRIYLFQELLDEGEYDWVLYMDADAIVVDLGKSLQEFLDDRYSIVACRGATDDPSITWNINNGVMFMNLRHPHTKNIVHLWRTLFEKHTMEALAAEEEGVFDDQSKHINDQDMLCLILYHKYRQAAKIYRGEEATKFNYSGSFIQQLLRVTASSLEERIENMRQKVAEVEAKHPQPSQRRATVLL